MRKALRNAAAAGLFLCLCAVTSHSQDVRTGYAPGEPPGTHVSLTERGHWSMPPLRFSPAADLHPGALRRPEASPTMVYTVTTTNDTGDGSLRKAINDANDNPGPDVITFDIPGNGPFTITPQSKLPSILDPVTIDGETQPGYVSQPVIEINGGVLGAFQAFDIFAGGCSIRGLAINRLTSGSAIVVWEGEGNVFEGNFIGTNAAGTAGAKNLGNGILLYTGHNRIGGTTPAQRNIISGNMNPGVAIAGAEATGNVVEGNYIGTDITGRAAIGNVGGGVIILEGSSQDTIGGVLTGSGNVISGSINASGVTLAEAGTGIAITGNFIGTDVSGTSGIPNSGNGIYMTNTPSVTVGGTTAAARNVISGNTLPGVFLDSSGTTGTKIQGNFIGTDATALNPLPNSKGIVINDAPANTVGGKNPGEGNVISGNNGYGIEIRNAHAKNNIVQGNLIGTDDIGVRSLSNGSDGVLLNASDNSVGGMDAPSGNIIAFNGGAGVNVVSGTGNLVRYNSLFANGGLGIDLAPAGVNTNDTLDADTGPNNLQNHPDLDSVRISGPGAVVYGTLMSAPLNSYAVDLYTSDDADSSGFGEGKTLTATQAVMTDAGGITHFSFSLSSYTGQNPLTATATDTGRNTSEFSIALLPIQVTRPRSDELWVAKQRDTIRWNPANGVDTVKIFYSLDDGRTYTPIIEHYPANPPQYVWKVPDTLSRKCFILVQHHRKSGLAGKSGRFKIKEYVLTRLTATGDYEPFSPALHGWSFGNTADNLWPAVAWEDYLGVDQFTGRRYPSYFVTNPIDATLSDWPSWPMVVRAFGIGACYFDSAKYGRVYRPSAVQWWASKAGPDRFSGACQGMAISSAAAFSEPGALAQTFPLIGSYANLSSLPVNAPRRDMIDQLFEEQYGTAQLDFETTHFSEYKYPAWADSLKAFFLADQVADPIDLCVVHPAPSGGHVMTPYKVVQDSVMMDTIRVYVYDNNFPGDASRFVRLTGDGYWYYPGYFRKDGLYIEPASLYLHGAILPAGTAKSPVLAKLSAAPGWLEMDTPPGASTLITDALGDSTGYADSSWFTNFQGKPLVSRTGFFQPPVGFLIPEGNYTVHIKDPVDTTAYCTVFSDSAIYTYRRTGARAGQHDDVMFRNGFTVLNSDTASKSTYVGGIILDGSAEQVFGADGMSLAPGDSVRVSVQNGRDVEMQGGNAPKSYTLELRSASSDGEISFEHRGIPLPGGAAHLIRPVWADLAGQPVTILVSHRNDGTFDDSLKVENQITGVAAPGRANIPLTYSLSQNYPNPFNPSTTIRYTLPEAQQLGIVIYNLLGQRVATVVDQVQNPGHYEVVWKPAGELASGVYFIRMHAGSYVAVRKMLYVR